MEQTELLLLVLYLCAIKAVKGLKKLSGCAGRACGNGHALQFDSFLFV